MITDKKNVSSYFFCHGSPMMAVEDSDYTKFLEGFFTHKPKAIIIFTAHWESKTITISSLDKSYETMFDYYGFPEELYQVFYPAKGSVETAEKIRDVLAKNNIKSQMDTERGLDHGSWVLLRRLFPEADVPVVQISVNPFLDPKGQFEIGKALRDLSDDIVIIGSGAAVHNIRSVEFNATKPAKWAQEFQNWLVQQIKKKDYKTLFDYAKLAPNVQKAVPRPEHFVPLFIALGASDPVKEPKTIYEEIEHGSLSNLSMCFT